MDDSEMKIVCFFVASWLAIVAFHGLSLGRKYSRSSAPIGKAVGYVAGAVGVDMLGTFLFAVFEFIQWFPEPINWKISSLMRIVMGGVAFFSIANLAKRTDEVVLDYEIERGKDDLLQ